MNEQEINNIKASIELQMENHSRPIHKGKNLEKEYIPLPPQTEYFDQNTFDAYDRAFGTWWYKIYKSIKRFFNHLFVNS